jgi:polysaccharide export outer membrane protein
MTILDLLAQAGGTTERSGNTMYLIRANGSETPERRAIDLRGLQSQQYSLQLLSLQGGDSVFVPPAEQFYVYGEVNAPNMYRLEPEMTVLQAITRGGGLTQYTNGKRVEIKRRDASGKLVTRKAGLNEILQADDVIHVKGSLF